MSVSTCNYYDVLFGLKGLDFVVSEAKSHGVYLMLSLVNNWDDLGGRKQYVKWARDRGEHLNNDDEFYINPVVKGFYKNHVKVLIFFPVKKLNFAYKK